MRRSGASLPEKWRPLLKRRGDGSKRKLGERGFALSIEGNLSPVGELVPALMAGHDVRHDLPSGLQTCPSVKCTLAIAQIASWSLRSERSQALHIQVERLGCVLSVLRR